MNLETLINPTERQREFIKAIADHDFVLYGGAAGGGKSYILRWWLVHFLHCLYKYRGLKNVMVGLFSEDYPSLYDRQISKIKYEFPPEIGELKEGTVKNFQLRREFGGGMIALRNLDDPSKYQSAEFAAIAVDELTKSNKETFDFLRFRMRWPGLLHPKFAGATNPGGKGHAWVKKLWITRDFPAELQEVENQFAFVQAKASDNPHLSETYYKSLTHLPPDMAKKFAEGDWDTYTGQYFPHFNPQIHVIPHEEALIRIKKWHVRNLSGDWGFHHPHCFHWHAKDETDTVITHDEVWGRGVHETDVGKIVTECEAQYHKLQPLQAFTFSWDAGKLSPRSEKGQPKAISQLLEEGLGPKIPRPAPADSSPGVRLIRARLMSQVLQARTWYISDRCQKLIAAIPEMIRDEDHPEEMQKVDWNESQLGDDTIDSASMGLQWAVGASRKTRDILLEERFTEVRKAFAGVTESGPMLDRFAKFGGKRFN